MFGQVNALFSKQTAAETCNRKSSFRTERPLPSFQETDEATSPEGQPHYNNNLEFPNINSSEPIKIKKHCDSSHPNNSDPIPTIKSETSSVSSDPIPIKKCALDVSVENLSPGSFDEATFSIYLNCSFRIRISEKCYVQKF